MSDKNAATLSETGGEEYAVGKDVPAVGSRGKCHIAELVYHIDADYLREAVAELFAHGRDADEEEVLQFANRERTEIFKWEAADMLAGVESSEKEHGNAATQRCGDGCTFHAESRETELTEDEYVVSDEVKDVADKGDYHRIDRLVCTAKGC